MPRWSIETPMPRVGESQRVDLLRTRREAPLHSYIHFNTHQPIQNLSQQFLRHVDT